MRALLNSVLAIGIIGCIISCTETPNTTQDTVIQTSKTNTKESTKKKILFFGNSITAAYGLDPSDAFSNIIQLKIDSAGLAYTCINAGNSGETTKGGLERLDWVTKDTIAIMVLELGANDGLRGYDVSASKQNLKEIIKNFRAKFPDSKVLLAGMNVPPSMGEEYFQKFAMIYPEIAQEENVELIPFILEGVAGNPELNLPDGIHPTAEGHLILAETVWRYLYPML